MLLQLRNANARLEDEVASLRKLVAKETSVAICGGDAASQVAHSEDSDRLVQLERWLDGVISVSIDCQEALTVAIATDIHTNNDVMVDPAATKLTQEKLFLGLGLRLQNLMVLSQAMHRCHLELLRPPWRPGSGGREEIIAAHEATALRLLPLVVYDAALGKCSKTTLTAVLSTSQIERRRDWDLS